jgi:hypothetical protein
MKSFKVVSSMAMAVLISLAGSRILYGERALRQVSAN